MLGCPRGRDLGPVGATSPARTGWHDAKRTHGQTPRQRRSPTFSPLGLRFFRVRELSKLDELGRPRPQFFPSRSDMHFESGVHSKSPLLSNAIAWEAACRSANCFLRVEKHMPRDFESSHDPLDTLLDGEIACYQEGSCAFFICEAAQAAIRWNFTDPANPYCWSFRRVELICS